MCVYGVICQKVMLRLLASCTKIYCQLLCWPPEYELIFLQQNTSDESQKTQITSQQRYFEWQHIMNSRWTKPQKRAISLRRRTVTTGKTAKREYVGKAERRQEMTTTTNVFIQLRHMWRGTTVGSQPQLARVIKSPPGKIFACRQRHIWKMTVVRQ